MATPVMTQSSTVMCPHGVPAQHVPSQVRVRAAGSPVLVLSDMGQVAGCPFTLPNGTPSPCVTVQWLVAAVRVRAGGQFVLLQSSVGLSKSGAQVPQGPPVVSVVQPRVMAT
jgi:hypothetical protein